jgi:hypothetical protein
MSESESFGEEDTFGGSPTVEESGDVDVDFDYGDDDGGEESEEESKEEHGQQAQ